MYMYILPLKVPLQLMDYPSNDVHLYLYDDIFSNVSLNIPHIVDAKYSSQHF